MAQPDGSYAFGGTCLNAGCIPSKALLESSELYVRAKEEFGTHGIKLGDIQLDLAQMQKRRASIVKTMTGGISALFKAAGVVGIQGTAASCRKQSAGQGIGRFGKDTRGKERDSRLGLDSDSPERRCARRQVHRRFVDALEFDAVPRRSASLAPG